MFRKESVDGQHAEGGSKVAVTLTGHAVRGCTGGLTDAVFHLAELIG